jgi:hypothetical protein
MQDVRKVASGITLSLYGAILLSVGVTMVDAEKQLIRFQTSRTRFSQAELLKIWNRIQIFELDRRMTGRFFNK